MFYEINFYSYFLNEKERKNKKENEEMSSRMSFNYLSFVLFIVSLCSKYFHIIYLILCAHYA